MDNLDRAAGKRNKEWKDLEQTITKLIQEHYRLMGKVVYEPVAKELDEVLDDGLVENFELN